MKYWLKAEFWFKSRIGIWYAYLVSVSRLCFYFQSNIDDVFIKVEDDNDSGEVDFGNFVDGGTDYTDEISSSQDPFSQSQDVFTQGNNTADGTVLSGDKLLAQPYKVHSCFVLLCLFELDSRGLLHRQTLARHHKSVLPLTVGFKIQCEDEMRFNSVFVSLEEKMVKILITDLSNC